MVCANIIYLNKRSVAMLKKDLIIRNPLRLLGESTGQMLTEGWFGAVLARAGVGKTSFLVQLALDSLLGGKNVLHISLGQAVKKVCLWYEEVFRNISREYQLENNNELWEEILPHRFIMTFNAERFKVPRLEERLADLTEQGIFFPQVVLIDGLLFDDATRDVLSELKLVARDHHFPVWFAVKTHGDDEIEPDGIPLSVAHTSDLFDIMIQLTSRGKGVHVELLKGKKGRMDTHLILDPATFLIKQS
ncbi:MAG: cytoplasmic protein [Dissulfurimicrobium sp.]|uniref:cytoplasmic protein n=1 Tax=Dissulfurimicrobium sp. TaxID=2022436 RepID=UPI003D0CEF75